MLLILFFMYIFPIFFLGIPVLRMTPIVATIFLILGIIFWTMNGLKIRSFIMEPKKTEEKLRELQERGQPVRAKVLESKNMGLVDGYPMKKITIEFTNLGGNPVKTSLEAIDSKPHEERFVPGKYIDLKLNRTAFEPALTISGSEYEINIKPIVRFWPILHFVYAFGFFLVAYYFQNDGYGWRFLNPFHPWIWSPIVTMVMLKTFSGFFSADGISHDSDLQSEKAMKGIGELLLYGKLVQGEIVNYRQTGLYINEQPQILFNVLFEANGQLVNQNFKQVVNFIDLANLKKGEVEVLYLPSNPDIFTINFA